MKFDDAYELFILLETLLENNGEFSIKDGKWIARSKNVSWEGIRMTGKAFRDAYCFLYNEGLPEEIKDYRKKSREINNEEHA